MSTSIERPLLRIVVVAALTLLAVVAAALSPSSADARDRDGDRTVTESRPGVEDDSAKPTPLPTPSVGPAWEKPILFALGDSYASGEGVPPFVLAHADERFDIMEAAGFSRLTGHLQITADDYPAPVANERPCHRSDLAAARVLSEGPVGPGLTFERVNFVACSGATTASLLNPQWNFQPAQLDVFAAEPDTTAPRVITVSIGGNDLGFESILTYCGKLWHDCRDPNDPGNSNFLAEIAAGLGDHKDLLKDALDDIAEANGASPGVVVLVGGPELFDPDCGSSRFYEAERLWLNGLAWDVDLISQQAVFELQNEWAVDPTTNLDIRYARTIPAFDNGRVCSIFVDHADQLIHGYVFDPFNPSKKYWSFHPNQAGQAARADVIRPIVNAWLNAYYW